MKRSLPESHGYKQLLTTVMAWVGMMHSVRAKSAVPRHWRIAVKRAASERCVCTTPFGCPVEPEVKMISAYRRDGARGPDSSQAPAITRLHAQHHAIRDRRRVAGASVLKRDAKARACALRDLADFECGEARVHRDRAATEPPQGQQVGEEHNPVTVQEQHALAG